MNGKIESLNQLLSNVNIDIFSFPAIFWYLPVQQATDGSLIPFSGKGNNHIIKF